MGRIRSILAATCAVVFLTSAGAAAQGTTSDRLTNVTFSGPVSIPGKTLPAGTYQFKLFDSLADRHIVQIFDQNQKLVATILAIPAERAEQRGDPVITFKETRSDLPPAVHYWYYAGEKSGNELVYPKSQAMAIAQASGEPVMAMDTDSSDVESWKKSNVSKVTASAEPQSSTATSSTTVPPPAKPDTTTEPKPATTTTAPVTTTPTTTAPVAATPTTTEPTTMPEPQPTTVPAPTPSPAPVTTEPAPTPSQPEAVGTSGHAARRSLPRTASELPAVGLIGLIALAGALAVRAARKAIV